MNLETSKEELLARIVKLESLVEGLLKQMNDLPKELQRQKYQQTMAAKAGQKTEKCPKHRPDESDNEDYQVGMSDNHVWVGGESDGEFKSEKYCKQCGVTRISW